MKNTIILGGLLGVLLFPSFVKAQEVLDKAQIIALIQEQLNVLYAQLLEAMKEELAQSQKETNKELFELKEERKQRVAKEDENKERCDEAKETFDEYTEKRKEIQEKYKRESDGLTGRALTKVGEKYSPDSIKYENIVDSAKLDIDKYCK